MEAAARAASPVAPGKTVVFFDGVCVMCNGTMRFLLERDRRDRLRFASLQSDFAGVALAGYQKDARELSNMFVIADYGLASQRLLARSAAAFHLAGEIGGVWTAARALSVLPRRLVDRVYDFVADHRYRWFGKYDSCPLPPAEHRRKFLS